MYNRCNVGWNNDELQNPSFLANHHRVVVMRPLMPFGEIVVDSLRGVESLLIAMASISSLRHSTVPSLL